MPRGYHFFTNPTSSPAAHSRRVSEEIKTWKDVIARAGVKLE